MLVLHSMSRVFSARPASHDPSLCAAPADRIFREIRDYFLSCPVCPLNSPLPSLLPQTSPRHFRLWVLFGVIVAIMQLTDSLQDATLAQVVFFWAARLTTVIVSLVLAEWVAERLLANRWTTPTWLKPGVVTMLLAAVPMAFVESGLETIIPQTAEYDDAMLRAVSPLLAVLGEYATIASLLVPINLLLWVLIDQRGARHPPERQDSETDESEARLPGFLAKTEGIELEDVIALTAQEHYVRVCTPDRSELIYYRFGDAVAELPAAAGMQVHRSWWVALRGIAGARRAGRRYQLELLDGTVVPVSDRYLDKARRRGLLANRRPAQTSL